MPSEVCSSTRSTNWCRVVCARSIVIPPSPVITAVPVKGIIDPTSVRTIGRSPKRVSPYSTDYAADDRPWRPGDKEARSRTKRRTNGVSSRVGGRGCHKSDECGCHEHCLARECPDRKTPASVMVGNRFGITFPILFWRALHVENLSARLWRFIAGRRGRAERSRGSLRSLRASHYK